MPANFDPSIAVQTSAISASVPKAAVCMMSQTVVFASLVANPVIIHPFDLVLNREQ